VPWAPLPAVNKALLPLRQSNVAGADQALNPQLDNILGFGTVRAIPRLQSQIARVSRVPYNAYGLRW